MFSARFACSNGQLQSIISLSAYSRWFYLFFGQLESSAKTLTFRVLAYRWRNTVLKFSFSYPWHKLQVQCDEVWYFEFFYWSGIQVLQIDCEWIKIIENTNLSGLKRSGNQILILYKQNKLTAWVFKLFHITCPSSLLKNRDLKAFIRTVIPSKILAPWFCFYQNTHFLVASCGFHE